MDRDKIAPAATAEFTLQQEKIHASLHILGILFGLIAIPNLLLSAQHKDRFSLLGISVYGLCFLMVFTFSTLYHSFTDEKSKRLFKKLDRISIYFLIAGTYTPLILFYVFDTVGLTLLCILWGLVVPGLLFEIYFPDRFPVVSVLFYLFMGLIAMFVPRHFFAAMPHSIMLLVLSGMLMYVLGVIFYLWQRWTYHHAVWHLFVLSGSIFHYMAVLYTA